MSLKDVFIIIEDRTTDAESRQRANNFVEELTSAANKNPKCKVYFAKSYKNKNKGVIEKGDNIKVKFVLKLEKTDVQLEIRFDQYPVSNKEVKTAIGSQEAFIQNAGYSPSWGGEDTAHPLQFSLDLDADITPFVTKENLEKETRQSLQVILKDARRIMFHEVVHMIDDERMGPGKMRDVGNTWSKHNRDSEDDNGSSYYRQPLELNPNTQEAIDSIVRTGDIGNSPAEFADKVIKFMNSKSRYGEYVTGDERKKVLKRVSTTWQHLKEK